MIKNTLAVLVRISTLVLPIICGWGAFLFVKSVGIQDLDKLLTAAGFLCGFGLTTAISFTKDYSALVDLPGLDYRSQREIEKPVQDIINRFWLVVLIFLITGLLNVTSLFFLKFLPLPQASWYAALSSGFLGLSLALALHFPQWSNALKRTRWEIKQNEKRNKARDDLVKEIEDGMKDGYKPSQAVESKKIVS